MKINVQKHLAVAKRAAREAGVIIRTAAGDPDMRQTKYKDLAAQRDLVTETDKRSQDHIMMVLREKCPDTAFLGEESDRHAPIDPETPTWVVDPMDGTTNHAAGLKITAVAIALMCRGMVILSVVYDVWGNHMYWAVEGGGAFKDGFKIAVTTVSTINHALIGTDLPADPAREPVIFGTLAQVMPNMPRGVRMLGSAVLSICHVAEGVFGVYWNIQLRDWDVAAALLILTEAGGRLNDERGALWQPRGEAHGIVAAAPQFFDELAAPFFRAVGKASGAS